MLKVKRMRAEEYEAMAEELFVGGGEMGALLRSHDWSQTQLGAIETWSDSLKTAVQTLLIELDRAKLLEKQPLSADLPPADIVAIILQETAQANDFRGKLTEALRPLSDPTEIQAIAARILGESLGVNRVIYTDVISDGTEVLVHKNYTNGVAELSGRYLLEKYRRNLPENHQAGQTQIVTDIPNNPRYTDAEKARYRAIDVAAHIDVPLIKNNRFVALLAVHQSNPRQWTEAEVKRVEETAEQTWAAVERARAEAALRDSEERFRQLSDALPQLVWTAQPDGKVDYVNGQWLSYTSIPPQEFYAWGWQKIVHPDDLPATLTVWAEALQTGEPIDIKHRFRRSDGQWRWQLVRGISFKNDAGQVVKWFGTCTDIHENEMRDLDARFLEDLGDWFRQASKDRLRASESVDDVMQTIAQRLGQYLDASRCCFAEIDRAADQWTVSHDYTSIAELPSLVGNHSISTFPPEVITALQAGRAVNVPDAMTDPITAALYATRYQPLDIRSFVVVPLLREGQWVSAIGVFMNTPHPWTERELVLISTVAERTWNTIENLRLLAELQVSEAQFRNMADYAPIMVWVTDARGYCTYLSQSWYEFSGQTEATGLGFGWLDIVHPNDRAFSEATFLAANERQEAFQIEYRLRRQDGQYRTCIDAAKPRFGADGEFKGYIGSVIDIDDRIQAEAEREQLLQREQTAREAAETANRIKDEFLAVLSHELRSPLNPILGWSKLLRHGKLDATRTVNAIEIIERNAQLQVQLIEDLLDISRILRGKLALTVAPVDLSAVIAAALETVQLAAEAKSLQIQTLLSPTVGTVNGDAGRLQQVVWNLLSNAVKFTSPGGWIEVRLEEIGNRHAQITVADSGKGISPEFLPYVFEHFRQEDGATTRKFGGLGLGLAIARQIVELHGGQISVESSGEGQGTTFIVRLPLFKRWAEGEPGRAEEPPRLSPSTSQPLTGLLILVVDDDHDSRELVAFVLEQAGANTTQVASGIEALQVIEQVIPGLIISDIGMPDLDGYGLLQKIRARASLGQIPAIALTAYAGELDQQQAIAAGFQIHLSKPVDPEALVEAVVTLIKSSPA
ncbi:MAG: PAS domain-containing protein [Leptolyngbyaceae cyanobacterium bins.302]|nr:PAS domain-containing protein [Leptolyngbyaceae cyanobacterium bins.302]